MASIVFLEPGTDATGDFAFFSSTTGTVASDATVSKTGSRSVKISNDGSVSGIVYRSNAAADTGRRWSFWFRFNQLPAASVIVFGLATSAAANVHTGSLRTDGKIANTGTGATNVNGTAVLAINTWYRITLSYVITNSTTFKFNVYVNGVLDSSAVAGTLTNTASNRLRMSANTTGGNGFTTWYDNIYVDDGSDYTDPGDIPVTAKRPAANNTNSFDTAVGANPANRWTNVNEVPLSITNGWKQVGITDTQENFTLEAAAVGDVDISTANVVGRTAWIWAKQTVVLGAPKIMDNGTESAITLTTSPALYTVITTGSTYPSNAAGIGMRAAGAVTETFLYECGTLIAYKARQRAHVT